MHLATGDCNCSMTTCCQLFTRALQHGTLLCNYNCLHHLDEGGHECGARWADCFCLMPLTMHSPQCKCPLLVLRASMRCVSLKQLDVSVPFVAGMAVDQSDGDALTMEAQDRERTTPNVIHRRTNVPNRNEKLPPTRDIVSYFC